MGVTETSLPCMLPAIYILHGKYLALINSHLKLQLCAQESLRLTNDMTQLSAVLYLGKG